MQLSEDQFPNLTPLVEVLIWDKVLNLFKQQIHGYVETVKQRLKNLLSFTRTGK